MKISRKIYLELEFCICVGTFCICVGAIECAVSNKAYGMIEPVTPSEKRTLPIKTTNFSHHITAVEQTGESLHIIANCNHPLAFGEKTDKGFRNSSNNEIFNKQNPTPKDKTPSFRNRIKDLPKESLEDNSTEISETTTNRYDKFWRNTAGDLNLVETH